MRPCSVMSSTQRRMGKRVMHTLVFRFLLCSTADETAQSQMSMRLITHRKCVSSSEKQSKNGDLEAEVLAEEGVGLRREAGGAPGAGRRVHCRIWRGEEEAELPSRSSLVVFLDFL
jgi:hypothetical protein